MIVNRKMDYLGLLVRSKTQLTNGWASLPSGKILTVTGWSRGLGLKSEPCPCCGIQLSIARVDIDQVEVLDCEYNNVRLAWNEERKYEKNGFNGRWLKNPDRDKPKPEDYNYGKNPNAITHNFKTIDDILRVITPENIDAFALDFTAFMYQVLLLKATTTYEDNPEAITFSSLQWKDDGIRKGTLTLEGREIS